MSLEIGIPYGYDIVECISNPSVNKSTNIEGSVIKFNVSHNEDACYVGKKSYLSACSN